VLFEKYESLKEIFTHLSVKSNFPGISPNDFCDLMARCGLADNKTCTQGIIDTQFIASRVDAEKRGFKAMG
jgi:hypothetical protein